MGSFSLLVVLCTFVLLLDAAPDKNRNELLSQKFEPSVGRSAAPLRRDKRFAVSAIWTAMGLIKDFSDRVTFIKETIAKVKSWFGVGDAPGTPPPNTQDVINEINGIKDQVEDLRDDVLAGQEWGFVLSVLGDPIKNLKALVFQEDDYLGEMKQSGLADSLKKLAQNRFYINQVNDPACSDRRNLASLQNGILSGTGIHKPLYEAYADKIGQQNTGTALDVVKFIARTQQMQAHVYALLEEGVDFKPISSTEKQHEIDLYQYDVQRVTPRQGPRNCRSSECNNGSQRFRCLWSHQGQAQPTFR
ncbi:uncharacterized protein [Montipora capricornis]|uniref:uncharacterized protein n=1 Tax=Montipora capricornis TaxID=246305 RepID=UPI0035F18826